MSPLVALTLLAFGVVLVAALLLWTLLSPPRRKRPERSAERRAPAMTNDEVRGARVRPTHRPKSDDAFERFLHAEPDDG